MKQMRVLRMRVLRMRAMTLRPLSLLLVALSASALTSCGGNTDLASRKTQVVAAFYPLAEVVRWVGGDLVSVTDLTPPGAEPHDLELTSNQVDAIRDADLAVVTGGEFQPSLEDAARQRSGATLVAIKSPGIKGNDPHVWLDPKTMSLFVNSTAAALAKVDPAQSQVYKRRAIATNKRLDALDIEMSNGLANCDRRVIVTSHDSFDRLGARYGVRVESIAGFSPEEDPNPRRIAQLADLVKKYRVAVIFTEELVSPRVAEVLAREVGVGTEVLSPIEGLSPEAAESGDDYFSLMRRNLAQLERSLGCVSR